MEMRSMQGQFRSTLPHKDMNIHNLMLKCKCNFITLKLMEDGRMEFLMEPRCLKHLLNYAEWKFLNRAVPMNGLKLDYKWNEYSDGTTDTIK